MALAGQASCLSCLGERLLGPNRQAGRLSPQTNPAGLCQDGLDAIRRVKRIASYGASPLL